MKVLSLVGARPQFVKAAGVSRLLQGEYGRQRGLEEFLVHSGQHYDPGLSQIFFDELGIPKPGLNLGVGSGSHAETTARILLALEPVLCDYRPDVVLVYGDTNTTLAGALCAAKLRFPVAHVEAGLRSFNRNMPEETNRVVADHLADLLLCPTRTAVENLAREGISKGVHLVGDVMFDVALHQATRADRESTVLARLGLEPRGYALATVHRQENTDQEDRLAGILAGLRSVARGMPVVMPVHPRTRAAIAARGWDAQLEGILATEPVSYLDMVALESHARVVLTDSGGVQKEAFFFGVPCVTLRVETEWVETIEAGANRLAGWEETRIVTATAEALRGAPFAEDLLDRRLLPYGDGRSAERMIDAIAGLSATNDLGD